MIQPGPPRDLVLLGIQAHPAGDGELRAAIVIAGMVGVRGLLAEAGATIQERGTGGDQAEVEREGLRLDPGLILVAIQGSAPSP